VVLPDSPIKRLEDLKSKTIGAPSFGAGGGLALKANLRDIGIMPDQYTALSIGAGPAAFAALVNKQVDALVTWDAMLGAAENTGLALRTVNIPLQDSLGGMTIATTESYAKSNPKALEGVCRAFTKGLHFARTNREAAIRAFWQEFPTTRPANLDPNTALKNQVHILDRFLEKAMMGVPYDGKTGVFNPVAWQNSQATYQGTGALKGSISAESGYTTRFVDVCNAFDREAVAADAKKY